MGPQLYTVTATLTSLPQLLEPLGWLGDQLSKATRLRVQTVLEELFANTINHGYGPKTSSTTALVWLSIQLENATLHVRYEDAAPAFDPFAGLDVMEQGAIQDLEMRRVGGLGRLLVQKMSDSASYARVESDSGPRNRIDLTFIPRDR